MAISMQKKHWTAAEVRALPDDGNRYEIVDGELLVTPSPAFRHQSVHAQLFTRLQQYLATEPVGLVLSSPADIDLGDDTVVQPDLFVLPAGLGVREWEDIKGRLLLAIEILSPSTARWDRTLKRKRYQRAAFPEYWIVDTDARLVERWRPDDQRPEILTDALTWQPDPSHPPLVISLPELFTAALGE